MASGATKREIFEKKLEKRLQDPKIEPLVCLPLDFLEDITCKFSTELGRGGCGVVYKGVLWSGRPIAVKKLSDTHLLGPDDQVEKEIINLKDARHQNVVQLAGYCVETKKVLVEHNGKNIMAEERACLLCFEFLCNQSLDKHLSVLDWDMRYEIIRGVCRGLHYLHVECNMVHLDLKPQNILMDATMMPKIADFGLSKLLGEQKSKTITKNSPGTLGYMAPEYIDYGIISCAADIFSLGVTIIEIMTGRRDYPYISEITETSLKHFIEEVVGIWRNRLLEITPKQISVETHIKQVEQCISLALKCLEPESNKRPTSLDIVQSLNAVEPKCTSPENPSSVIEKGRRYQNIGSQVGTMNMIKIPNTNSAVNSQNECANSFQCSDDHQYLSNSLPRIYDLIDRAEWRTHVKCVADLLPKLKDAAYDAEDLLDEFRWYETKDSVDRDAIPLPVNQGGFNRQVTCIKNRLNHLSGELEKVGSLQPIPRFGKPFRLETSSLRTEEKFFGRDKEKGDLIRFLGVPTKNSMAPSGSKRKRSGKFVHDRENNKLIRLPSVPTKNSTDPSGSKSQTSGVQVLPIFGIGGVGKTTLAQDICNHLKVKHHFKPIIWICVSEDFDVKRLTKEALDQSSSPAKVPKTDSLNLLQGALGNSLNGKRFLLVLDDMWDENEQDWKQFCAPFRDAANGSMMLVTTRSQKVADVVRTMDPFRLDGLNEVVFREFFKHCVFGSHSSNNYPELERIGEEILPKLKGSPLAAKTLGRLLGMSLEIAYWDRILKSQLWELTQEETDILPALRLSYMYLPSYLKRCFSFCAVYPKDYNFNRNDLAEIWVAEGLVESQHTGDQYFAELARRSFFQKYPRSQDKYVIHDLIHDMAQLVSKDECFIVKDTTDIPKIPQNVRHLSVLKGGHVSCDDLLNLCKHKKLRTLRCDLSLKGKPGVMEKWCAELTCMRVMVCSSIFKSGLPSSISNMKHLRYLKILDSCVCNSLPAEFRHLYNMQFFYAKKWAIDNIPSGFGMLINLQKFESVRRQYHHTQSGREIIVRNLPNVTSLGVDHRENVNSISFRSQSHNSTEVRIEDCEDLSSVEQFLQPAYVPKIERVEISRCYNLERVLTEKFGDLRFLQVLKVSSCPKIKSRRLFAPYLKELYLSNAGALIDNIECSSLTRFDISAYHQTESIELKMWNLPSLRVLSISFCRSLKIIRYSEAFSADLFHSRDTTRMGNFPLLTRLTISNCAQLKTMDDLLCLPAIESVKISYCGLQSLSANRLGDSSRLKDLEINHCSSLDGQSALLLPSSLQKLQLLKCRDFSGSFPTCLEKLTNLVELKIIECECILSVPGDLWHNNLKSLKRLEFWNCPKLKSIGGPNAIAHMTDLIIEHCPELKEIDQPLRKGNIY